MQKERSITAHYNNTLSTGRPQGSARNPPVSMFSYLSIICPAYCAACTSQKGRNVPIAKVPTSARPRASQEKELRREGWDCSTVATVLGGLTIAEVFGLTATVVAGPVEVNLPELPNFVEALLPVVVGTGVAGMAGAAKTSFSMNMVAATRR